jgi:hypothetical protein
VSTNKEIPVEEILKTDEFKSFLSATREFLIFIETESGLSKREFAEVSQTLLVNLYLLARQLPAIQLTSEKEFESEIDKSTKDSIFKFISDRIPFSYYWVALEPLNMHKSAEWGTGDLTDDLADIYIELKSSLILFDKDDIEAKEEAIWRFKFEFNHHWGDHCIEALSAIHHYLGDVNQG